MAVDPTKPAEDVPATEDAETPRLIAEDEKIGAKRKAPEASGPGSEAETVPDEVGGSPAKKKRKLAPPEWPSEDFVLDENSGMHVHKGMEWMYNESDSMFVHIPTSSVWMNIGGVVTEVSTEAEKPPQGAHSGKIAWFDPVRNYGFISRDGEEDLFVHSKNVRGTVVAEDEVTYDIGDENGRPCAVNVQPVHESAAPTEADSDNGSDVADDDSEFEADIVQGTNEGVSQLKGPEKEDLEDRALSKTRLPLQIVGDDAEAVLFGVFDGHNGFSCAEYCHSHLASNIMSGLRGSRNTSKSDIDTIKAAIKKGFNQTEHNFLQSAKKTQNKAGTTACVALLYGPDSEGCLKIITANCGDSRAVLSRNGKAARLTDDHKPNRPDEKKRIEQLGGKVANMQGIWRVVKPMKVQKGQPQTVIGLAVSRSLGDIDWKAPEKLVSPEPEMYVYDIDFDQDEALIICSDGIFDVMTDDEVVRIAREHAGRPKKAADALIARSKELGSRDDKTAQVIEFGWHPANKKPETDDEAEKAEPEAKEKVPQASPDAEDDMFAGASMEEADAKQKEEDEEEAAKAEAEAARKPVKEVDDIFADDDEQTAAAKAKPIEEVDDIFSM